MTIKRRIFISNMLMLVIPILISIIFIAITVFTAMNILGIRDNGGDGDQFYHIVDQVRSYNKTWSQANDIDRIKSDINTIEGIHDGESVFLVIYQNGEQQYSVGIPQNNSFIEAALSEDGEHYVTVDQFGIFRTDAGEYTVLVVDTNLQNMNQLIDTDYYQNLINISVVLIVVVILVIGLTNRLLTRMVIKRIITPLDTLVYGVHQIRDGNLSYRIAYDGKDEFAAVCEDFNEMAQRLMDMVNARQKDDENRRELIAGISHDLRTPLTSIKAYVEGLEKGVASTPQIQKKYLDTIKNKTADLEHIVTQLFMFSKIDIGDFPLRLEPLDIGEELSSFVKGVSEEYEKKGLSIQLSENVQGIMVNADSVQLRSVFTNLLENSVKYGDKEHGEMRVVCRLDNGSVRMAWMDNGPGVADDALEKLFHIFYRGDKARTNTSQGSGLGLAISAKIMGLLGGSIQAQNAPGGGLSITLTLPIAKEDEDEDEEDIDY